MPITAHTSESKPVIAFQYGGLRLSILRTSSEKQYYSENTNYFKHSIWCRHDLEHWPL